MKNHKEVPTTLGPRCTECPDVKFRFLRHALIAPPRTCDTIRLIARLTIDTFGPDDTLESINPPETSQITCPREAVMLGENEEVVHVGTVDGATHITTLCGPQEARDNVRERLKEKNFYTGPQELPVITRPATLQGQ